MHDIILRLIVLSVGNKRSVYVRRLSISQRSRVCYGMYHCMYLFVLYTYQALVS